MYINITYINKETLREVRRARRSPPRQHSGEWLFWEGKGNAQ